MTDDYAPRITRQALGGPLDGQMVSIQEGRQLHQYLYERPMRHFNSASPYHGRCLVAIYEVDTSGDLVYIQDTKVTLAEKSRGT